MSSPNTRLARLLVRGFYPRELPPPFRTRHFTRVRNTLSAPDNYSGSTTFFRGANHRGDFRSFGIVNPLNYFLLSRFIAHHWADIKHVYSRCSSSGTVPRFPSKRAPGRALEAHSLGHVRAIQHRIASTFPIVIHLDINNFYGSVYTHAIPWVVLGKQTAKIMHNNNTLTGHWSNALDKLVRACNQRQTIGIPIGPDTSRVISELILSRIDADLTSRSTNLSASQLFHQIDDYQLGAYNASEAEAYQASVVEAIARYELRLNDFKTKVDHGPSSPVTPFEHRFDILEGKDGHAFVDHFFDIISAETVRLPQNNIAGYALKSFARILLANSEPPLIANYLQRLLFSSPPQARFVLPLLLAIYQHHGFDKPKVRRLLTWAIETSTRRGDAGTVLWFLYAAMFLEIRLDARTCNACIGLSCELVDLVLFHGKATGLFSLSVADLRRRYKPADFKSPAWLPLYEVERNGWDTTSAFSKIGTPYDRGHHYEHLRAKGVQFYVSDPRLYTTEAFHDWNMGIRTQDPDQQPGSSFSLLPYD